MIVLAFPRSLIPILLLIAIMGWGAVTQLTTMNTLIQLQAPNGLRGRVFSTYLWALQGAGFRGNLRAGRRRHPFTYSITETYRSVSSV
jgi:hypothetical protein